jgi:hypothetical protein
VQKRPRDLGSLDYSTDADSLCDPAGDFGEAETTMQAVFVKHGTPQPQASTAAGGVAADADDAPTWAAAVGGSLDLSAAFFLRREVSQSPGPLGELGPTVGGCSRSLAAHGALQGALRAHGVTGPPTPPRILRSNSKVPLPAHLPPRPPQRFPRR